MYAFILGLATLYLNQNIQQGHL